MPNKSGNPESINKKSQQLKSTLTNVLTVVEDLLKTFCKLRYSWFCVSGDQWKNTVYQRLYLLFESHFYENNSNFSCNRFSYKLVFIIFLFFCMKQKQKSIFQKVGGLVIKNIFDFCLQRLTLYLKGMSNSLDSYKWIFWNFIPVCL